MNIEADLISISILWYFQTTDGMTVAKNNTHKKAHIKYWDAL